MWYDYGYGMGGHPHFMHGPFSIIAILLLIAVIAFAVRFFVKGKHKHMCQQQETGSEAMTLLETRYVQGEIDRDEFLKKKADLTGESIIPAT